MAAGHAHIGRGEPQLGTAPVIAVDHLAPDLVGPAQQGGRLFHPALTDQGPYPRGGDRLAHPARAPRYRPAGRRRPPRSPAVDPISRNRATFPFRPWPKWKSSPTTTSRASSPSTRTPSTNSSAVSLARSTSKRMTTVRSTPAAASSSSFWSRSQRRRGADSGTDHGGRVTVEGHHHRGQTVAPGPVGQLGQQGAVTEVHSVVGPDGHRRSPVRRDAGRDVGHDVHYR